MNGFICGGKNCPGHPNTHTKCDDMPEAQTSKTVTLERQEIEYLRYWHKEQARFNEDKGWQTTAEWHRTRLAMLDAPTVETTEPVAYCVEASHDKSLSQPYLTRSAAEVYAAGKKAVHPSIAWTVVPLFRGAVKTSGEPSA